MLGPMPTFQQLGMTKYLIAGHLAYFGLSVVSVANIIELGFPMPWQLIIALPIIISI